MSAKTETGGPAFPCHADIIPSKDRDYAGMALRDYFMAHAPAEPQPWFMPAMPPAPDLSIWVGESGRKYDGERAAMGSEEGLRGKVRPVNKDAYRLWQDEQAKQRYVQWPAAWADEMLKAREVAAPAKPVDQVNAKLLEALKDALGFLEAVCFNTPNPKKRKDYADAASRCRAAISKATGEPQ